MKAETRERKKAKRSARRKQEALHLYTGVLEETYGIQATWTDWPKPRRNLERMREGFQKGINTLTRELQGNK